MTSHISPILIPIDSQISCSDRSGTLKAAPINESSIFDRTPMFIMERVALRSGFRILERIVLLADS